MHRLHQLAKNFRAPSRRLPNGCRGYGFSLLEVVAGVAVISLILIPTTSLMHDVLRGEAVQRQRGELMQLAQGKQNEFCHLARIQFRDSVAQGNFASAAYPDLVWEVRCSQDPAWGGINDRLLAVVTRAWHDANQNALLDAGETSVTLWTSVARTIP